MDDLECQSGGMECVVRLVTAFKFVYIPRYLKIEIEYKEQERNEGLLVSL